jgi:uncharacterized membrane protein YtjA (UPF0391 family)
VQFDVEIARLSKTDYCTGFVGIAGLYTGHPQLETVFCVLFVVYCAASRKSGEVG